MALKDGASPESVDQELEELEGKSDEDRKALLLQMIRTNSNKEFAYFKPMCFSDCDIGGDRYKAPPDRYPDGQSDDEEWLKDDPLGTSTQQYYVEMLDSCNRAPLKYYGREQKQKLRFAIQRWTAESTCCFSDCARLDTGRDVPRTWPTRIRYIRHLHENHLHHHTSYDCVVTGSLRASQDCPNGHRTKRRSDLVRHMVAKHGIALATSVSRVNKIHSAMWANFKAGSMEEGMEDFGGAGTGKCRGVYRVTMSGGRLHIDEGPMYEEYKVFRGDYQGRKRPGPTQPDRVRIRNPGRRILRIKDGRKSVLDSAAPKQVPVTFVSKQHNWSESPRWYCCGGVYVVTGDN